jgi:hypothetical protein
MSPTAFRLASCRRFHLPVILLTSFLLAPNPVAAQAVGLGSISGTVTDESGAALPGVMLKLTSPALQVPEVAIISDSQGRYRFADLRVGVYRVEAELDGFRLTIREKIDIPADFVARIDLTMALGSLNETITVSGASPVVDLSTTRGGQIVRAEVVARVLPMTGTPADMARLVPGVSIAPRLMNPAMGGAVGTGTYTAYGQAGSTVMVEEIQMTNNTITGNMNDTEQVDLKTFGGGAETWAPGVQTNFILKSGGNQFHGATNLLFMDHHFQSNNLDDHLRGMGFTQPESLDYSRDVHGNIGGPILKDKLWFFGSAKQKRIVKYLGGFQQNPGPDGLWLTGDEPTVPNSVSDPSGVAKVSYQITPKYRVSGFLWRDAIFEEPVPFGGIFGGGNQRTISYEHSSTYNIATTITTGEFQGTPRNNLAFNVKVAHTDYYAKWGLIESAKLLPSAWDRATGMYTGSVISTGALTSGERHGTAKWNTVLARLTYIAGPHEIKVGSDNQFIAGGASAPNHRAGNYILTFDTVGGVPHQPVQFRTLSLPTDTSNNYSDQTTQYITDRWQIVSRLVANIGIRFERQNYYVTASEHQAGTFVQAASLPAVDLGTWHTIAPRAGVAWDVTGNGKMVLKSTWGRFTTPLPYGVTSFGEMFNPNTTIQTDYRWNDRNRNNDYDPGEVDLSLTGLDFISATGGLSNTEPLTNFEIPHTNEFTASIERELAPAVAGRFIYVYKKSVGAYGNNNPGRPASVFNIPLQRRDPGPDGVIGNTDDGPMVTIYDYDPAYRSGTFNRQARVNRPDDKSDVAQTLEVSVSKRLSGGWSMGTAVNFIKQHRWLTPIVLSPNDEAYPLDTTWYNEFKLNGSLQLPLSFLLGGSLNVLSGVPGQRTYIFRAADPLGGPPLRQLTTVTSRLEEFGSQKGPVMSFLNLRLGETIKLQHGLQIVFSVDAINALNQNTAQITTYASGPTFGYITQIPTPRILQFGVDFSF